MMIHAAINILLLAVLLIPVGLWRPKWILFWMDEPSRFAIMMIFSVMVVAGVTLFGEGSRQKQKEMALAEKNATIEEIKKTTSPQPPKPESDLPEIRATKVLPKKNTDATSTGFIQKPKNVITE